MSFQSEQSFLFAFFVAYEISKQPLKRVQGDIVRNDAEGGFNFLGEN